MDIQARPVSVDQNDADFAGRGQSLVDRGTVSGGAALRHRLFAAMTEIGVFPFVMHVVVGLVTLQVVQASAVVATTWLGALALVLAAQALLVRRARALQPTQTVDWAIHGFHALSCAIGGIWGIGAWLFLDPTDFPRLLFFVFVTGGLIISAVATQYMLLRFCLSSIGIAYASLVARLLIDPFPFQLQIAGLLVLFCIVMAELARRLQQSLLRRIDLEAEKDHLLTRLTETVAALREAETTRARYMAQASHDLRQPLHAANLHVEAIRDETLFANHPQFQRLRASIRNLVDMFDGLMDFSLLDTGEIRTEMRLVALGPLLRDVVHSHERSAEAAGLAIRLVNTKLHVQSDPNLLKRILLNLVSNAVRYAPNSELLIGVRRSGLTCTIHVIDTGPGIPDGDRARVFEEFVRLDAPGSGPVTERGLGLGLSIVARGVQALGATVSLGTGPGGGCHFVLGPFQCVPPLHISEDGDLQIKERVRQRIILLDDDLEAAEALRAMLTRWDYNTEVYHRDAGLEGYRDADALIFDYDLGDASTGLDLLERLHDELETVPPALLISGRDVATLSARAEALQVPVLQKPVRPAQLRSVLLRVIGGQ